MSQFGSFWRGSDLTAFEASCLHSFVAAGHEVTLFAYEPIGRVPPGVRRGNAADIADQAAVTAFKVRGVPTISHFCDFFRYRLFDRTDLTWIATDVLLLQSWSQDPAQQLFALESPGSICNAVMRVASHAPWLPDLVAQAEAMMNTAMRHGDTGRRLLTRVAGNEPLIQDAAAPKTYAPVHFDEFWKVFLPEHADECRALCSEARTLHLWNDIVDRLGFWKEFLPPRGAYLHDLFVEKGCARYFRGEFPLNNMVQLVDNWRSGQTGQRLGVRSVVQQLVPSIQRTYRHYAG